MQTVLLLLDSCTDDGRSELLHTKLMALVLGEKYRAHGDVLFVYCQGAWQASGLGCLNAQDLEFLAVTPKQFLGILKTQSLQKVFTSSLGTQSLACDPRRRAFDGVAAL